MTHNPSAFERAQRLTTASGGDVAHAGRVLEAVHAASRPTMLEDVDRMPALASCPKCGDRGAVLCSRADCAGRA